MIESKKRMPSSWWYGTITVVGCLGLSGVVAGQDLPTSVSNPVPQLPAVFGVRPKAQFIPPYQGRTGNPQQAGASPTVSLGAAYSQPTITPAGVQLITLQEAQQKAAPADNNPQVRLGQLQVEVARQTRLGTRSTFFPSDRFHV